MMRESESEPGSSDIYLVERIGKDMRVVEYRRARMVAAFEDKTLLNLIEAGYFDTYCKDSAL